MELKRKKVAPNPRNVRARLPKTSLNTDTEFPISDKTIQRIYQVHCFDEDEDDPWQWLHSIEQDVLPEKLRSWRVQTAKHLLSEFGAGSWVHHVSIDPCASLLPKTLERLEELEVAAMGKWKWMSKKSSRKGLNPRAPATATKQASQSVTQVHWTPVFAKGKIRIYMCDPEAAKEDKDLPVKLNDAANLAKFVQNVLPRVMEEMKEAHGWSSIPRTVIHDKASYMVSPLHDRLNRTFSDALKKAGLRSWVGGESDSAKWLAPKMGDLYLHETAISHMSSDGCSRRSSSAAVSARRVTCSGPALTKWKPT